jgi:hypothetical protein
MGTRAVKFCDLTGEEPAQTYRVALDGHSGEIDLCEAEHDKLVKELEPYVSAARPAGSTHRHPHQQVRRTNPSPTKATKAGSFSSNLTREQRDGWRRWARDHNVKVPNGAFGQKHWDAYLAGTPDALPQAEPDT